MAMRLPRTCIMLLSTVTVAFVAGVAAGESLWTAGFRGYISAPVAGGLEPGDEVVVEIDAATDLSIASTIKDSKSLAVTLTGGEAEGLLDFLPAGTSRSDQKVSRTHEAQLRALIGARVERVDSARGAYVVGSRTVAMDGRQESIEVSGWVGNGRPAGISRVRFEELLEGSLTLGTLVEPGNTTFASEDIELAGAADADGATIPAAASLTPTARLALLLRYLNRIGDLIVQ